MYKIIILPHFKKQLKAYVKKYRFLKKSVIEELQHFDSKQHTHMGNSIYKLRVRTKDIQKGKSKSFRLMILLMEQDNYLVPITIYFKGDVKDISRKELNNHLALILLELQEEKK